MRRLGHDTLVESDLVAAGRILARESMDVVAVEASRLTTGARWLESLRAASPHGLLVLGLAASLDEEELSPLLTAGVDEFLVAPFPPADVRGRLTLLAQRRAASDQSLRERGRGEVARLADIVQLQSELLHAGLELQLVMQRICEHARSMCRADGAAVGMLEGNTLVYRITVGCVAAFQGFRLPVHESLTGASLLGGEVLYSADTERDPRVNVEATRKIGIRSMIAVPLRHGDRVVGGLNILSLRPHAFTEQETRTMELLAVMLGAALANATEFEAKQALASERAAALSALQESQELFSSFMNNSPALAYMKDSEGRRVWANEPYRRFFRLESAQQPASAERPLMPDEAVEHLRQKDREVLESGQPSTTEAQVFAPDGREHCWLTYRFIVRDGAGRRFLAAVSLDITERKRMEAAMRRSEESFRALIEGSPEAIFVHRGGPLVYVNPSALSFLGLSRPEVVGMSVLQFVHPDDRAQATGMLDVAPAQVRSGTSELRFLRRGGRVMTAEVSRMTLVFDGEPATVVSARDLTERKQMQSRLVLSDRLAAMGTLAAGVAHEINQPLTFVISNLAFLAGEVRALAGELPPGRLAEAEEVLREAEMGANKVKHIVADLKTFSRAEEDAPTVVNLQNVLESALTIARAELRNRARVVRDYADVPPVEGSESRFGQVFLNLLINAAQAIPEGHPDRNEIRVKLRAVQGHVIVEVSDTGAGIPPEMRSRIFDPFFTSKPVGVGTGLGLFVCQGIITRFGGEISVESQVGQGTTFRLIFPSARGFRESCSTPAVRVEPREGAAAVPASSSAGPRAS
ncbi:PAS domain S-box protein [Hyalangium gracile]|uniref:PAS domain S-box protein n=1 Tax=Hyalangium gracile TaxID=394092 RepID=UPI001CCAC03A|nr:PAS domain S-box protein [Hyalangium gracile]